MEVNKSGELLGADAVLQKVFPDQASRPSRRWLELRISEGKVRRHKLGRRVFFDATEFREDLERLAAESAAKSRETGD